MKFPIGFPLLMGLLTGCNGVSTPATGPNPPVSSEGVVGAWARNSSEYSRDHLVVRADGSGYTAQVFGTRVTLLPLSWSLRNDSLVIGKLVNGVAMSNAAAFLRRTDSLGIISRGFVRPDTSWFLRELDPPAMASDGERDTRLQGLWRGVVPEVRLLQSNNGPWIKDTLWLPQTWRFGVDGTGSTVDSCPSSCDQKPIARDTVNYSWWTYQKTVYIQRQSASVASGAVVMGWSLDGDSLGLVVLGGANSTRKFARVTK